MDSVYEAVSMVLLKVRKVLLMAFSLVFLLVPMV
jgi:hypothetical protein